MRTSPILFAAILSLSLAICDKYVTAANDAWAQAYQRTQALREVGRRIFSDPTFSASGKQSCASCHDPARRYNPPNTLAVQPGGADLRERGLRSPPTLTYINRVPPYENHHYDSDEEADGSIDNGPTGGLGWDGRIDTGAAQAEIPLTAKFEMANTRAGVAAAIRKAPYAQRVRDALGSDVLDDDERAFKAVVRALGAFEEDYTEFSPYTSKYDAFLTGGAQLSEQENRGLALFNDESKGNCAQCHRSARGKDGTPPVFSDYGLIALAVPRNGAIPRNRDPAFFDLGACGPERKDKAAQAEYCGLFRTPTLRNVSLRSAFFHNGKFHSLRDAVQFYVTRDITPARWYAKGAREQVIAYDDLPARYHPNINREAPFAGQAPGATPRLSQSEIDDVVAFMRTLTDGYLKDDPYRAERKRAANP
ncbi:MAG: c-type cytochrome [Gammaproteobacteria bacterium]|nr:MAG: c-type cytochrome [Gammaproteobacteria bacterium]